MDLRRAVHGASWVLLIASLATALGAWIAPIEVIQERARENAADDPLAQFEAAGAATAALWALRIVASLTIVIAGCAVRVSTRMARLLAECVRGFWDLTRPATSRRPAVASIGWRLVVAAWLALAVSHGGSAIARHVHDWPIYRWRSGGDLLPNISESNQDVIRYLEVVTPEDARILVVSNQKLFFLSYYLLPRQIYHRTHPDAEFVIPQPNQQRPLPAYELKELGDAIAELRPDYILEYFEGPGADPERFTDDHDWLTFVRQLRRDPSFVPQYEVRLQRLEQGALSR